MTDNISRITDVLIKNYKTNFKPNEISPILRGLLSENKDKKFIVYWLNI